MKSKYGYLKRALKMKIDIYVEFVFHISCLDYRTFVIVISLQSFFSLLVDYSYDVERLIGK